MQDACMDTHTKVSACVDCGNAFHAASVLSKRCPPCQRLYVNAQTSIRDKNRRERRRAARMARAALGVSYEPLRDNGHRCRSCRRVLFLDCGRAQYHCHQCRDGLAVVDVLMQVVSLIVDVVTEHGPACRECGGWVPPWKTVTCSEECDKERGRQRVRDRYERLHGVKSRPLSSARQCRFCDSRIAATNTRGRGRSVCDTCGLHHGSFKSRARLYGVAYENVSRLAVFERDGWRCQLCGHKVLKKAKRNRHTRRLHPRTASLDHIIPMSKGGPHCEANVQCACLMCNVRKHARNIGQTRFF